ncbi:hypothetical protein AMIS_23730 [Actinoplanes missouriensis 431]|uniref:DUF1697 domain-containing protein n=1 Tax=Actinoplanes missouriensis (strain ATCC 14538 / DSM 43046 / CBS 188.64 / JCM 3121 / NBRC 102363 / NCIMB 12654 / NRRL B-3342 / UNCC 431) TaxID=512565 RepID=I0H3K6_ACTM4|nr:DUF1697 domain-containing protein [Actinoplanes missouriensis]BAL87593.1 hypothetical protein AMIS_23730 [Actinoplanes missouriensis 431]
MTRYAVLLRGINVGRNRRIAMADLRELLTGAGYANVATLLQSGNAVLDTDQSAAELGPALERLIEERFGFPVGVILRSQDELARIVALNPLKSVATDGSRYFVSFAGVEGSGAIPEVDSADQCVVDGAETYLWCPDGMRDSPLIKALTKVKNPPPSTIRNWNTVEKLLTLMS